MGKGIVAILLAASLAGCERRAQYLREQKGESDAQVVALCVRTEPPGAKVKVDRLERVWTTPCDIADFAIQRGRHEVHLSLEGYEPLVTRVTYDGYEPAWVQAKLTPLGAAVKATPEWMKPAKPAPVPADPVVPAPAPPPPPVEPVKPAPPPVQAEAASGGTRLKVQAGEGKVRILAKSVVMDPDRPGEIFVPYAPAQKIVVEIVNPKTDAVLHSVEITPSAPPAGSGKAPVAPPAAPSDADRVGEVKLVSKTYGVFVKLDPGLSLEPGEEILIFRNGKEVARTKILKVTNPDENYPDGAAQVPKDGSIKKGDEVRRSKP